MLKSPLTSVLKGEGMYLVFPVIVIVLLQYLSCTFGQNYKVNIADIIMTTMTMTKK